jgi:GNAT superfamily N-acetyltransferase
LDQTNAFSTLTAIGDRIGLLSQRHLETTFRLLAPGASVVHEVGFLRVMTGEPHPFGNLALVSEGRNLAGVRTAVEPLLAGGAPAAVLFPDGAVGPDVDAHLRELGFQNHAAMPAMAVEIDGLAETSLPVGYRLERAGGNESEAWAECFALGYEIPLGVARLFSPNTFGGNGGPNAAVQFFSILKGSRYVATSMLHLEDGLAGIYCVSTIPEERGKGLGAHATAEPLRLARRLGYGVGVLQSSEMGYSVYRRLGFADVGGVPLYVRLPS